MVRLTVITDRNEEIALVERSIRDVATTDRPLRILEAGCGQKWGLNLHDLNYVLTGVDLDPAALRMRMEVQKDLHEGIVGDLRSVQLPEGGYDVIYSYYVLEHIADVRAVLLNFTRWLRAGGIAIVKFPDPFSVYGFVARTTPHWFHVFYYRYVLGSKEAGKPGYAPYPVHYDLAISRAGIREFCTNNGVSLIVERGDGVWQRPTRLMQKLAQLFNRIMGPLSFGALSSRHSDLLFILRKA